jgi:hypothetical protein
VITNVFLCKVVTEINVECRMEMKKNCCWNKALVTQDSLLYFQIVECLMFTEHFESCWSVRVVYEGQFELKILSARRRSLDCL